MSEMTVRSSTRGLPGLPRGRCGRSAITRRGPARGWGGRVQRLVEILDNVVCVLDPYAETDSFGAHARAKLFFRGHLPMGRRRRMTT